MGSRIPTPHVYVNLHQTMAVTLAAIAVLAYIFDFKDVRSEINDVICVRTVRR